MKPDILTQHDVASELKSDQSGLYADISVVVREGIVTLRGYVTNPDAECNIEKVVWKVNGVLAIANEIQLKVMEPYERTDADIARAAVNALAWNYSLPNDLKVSVAKGWITLAGHIALDFQKDEAGTLVSSLMGVSGLTNNIVVQKNYHPANIQMTIEEALRHSLEWKSDRIRVSVIGGHVTLTGNVRSFSEFQKARRVAWNAPGVLMVENNLQVA